MTSFDFGHFLLWWSNSLCPNIHSPSSYYPSQSFPKTPNAPKTYFEKKKNTRKENLGDCISTPPPPMIHLKVSPNISKKEENKELKLQGVHIHSSSSYYPSPNFPNILKKEENKERKLQGLHIHSSSFYYPSRSFQKYF